MTVGRSPGLAKLAVQIAILNFTGRQQTTCTPGLQWLSRGWDPKPCLGRNTKLRVENRADSCNSCGPPCRRRTRRPALCGFVW